jgi:hypothetical protein
VLELQLLLRLVHLGVLLQLLLLLRRELRQLATLRDVGEVPVQVALLLRLHLRLQLLRLHRQLLLGHACHARLQLLRLLPHELLLLLLAQLRLSDGLFELRGRERLPVGAGDPALREHGKALLRLRLRLLRLLRVGGEEGGLQPRGSDRGGCDGAGDELG